MGSLGTPIDSSLIQQLLKGEEPARRGTVREGGFPNGRYLTPKKGPVKRKENQLFCVSKFCRIETWMTFDGIPYCTLHGINYLNDEIVRLTDRIEELIKQNRMPGDLFDDGI